MIEHWKCSNGHASSANMAKCRQCGEPKPDVSLTDTGHIAVTRKQAQPAAKPTARPKQKPVNKPKTDAYAGSAQDRQARGLGFAESFMDRARKED